MNQSTGSASFEAESIDTNSYLQGYIQELKEDLKRKNVEIKQAKPSFVKEISEIGKPVHRTRISQKEANQIACEECAEIEYKYNHCIKNPETWKDQLSFCSNLRKEFFKCKREQLKKYGYG